MNPNQSGIWEVVLDAFPLQFLTGRFGSLEKRLRSTIGSVINRQSAPLQFQKGLRCIYSTRKNDWIPCGRVISIGLSICSLVLYYQLGARLPLSYLMMATMLSNHISTTETYTSSICSYRIPCVTEDKLLSTFASCLFRICNSDISDR